MASADTAEMSLVQMCALFRSRLGIAAGLNTKDTVHAAAVALGLNTSDTTIMELAKQCHAALGAAESDAAPDRPGATASAAQVALLVDTAGSKASTSSRSTLRWRALKHTVVGTNRLRDLQLEDPKEVSATKKLVRRVTHARGINTARKAVTLRFGAKAPQQLPVDECLRSFLRAGELEMSAHVAHAARLVEALQWEAKGVIRDISAGEVYANCERCADCGLEPCD